MRYPAPLRPGDAIGVCAPSSGVRPGQHRRLDRARENVRALGYRVLESPSLRQNEKCVSADAETRAAQFTALWEAPSVRAILPPWGGEFLMDMLPCLDWERLGALSPKWLCGYSDITTLSFAMTTTLDIATVHGSNFMNMGFARIDPADLRAFDAMSLDTLTQESAPFYGRFREGKDSRKDDAYRLDKPSRWEALDGGGSAAMEGRVIGGCLDVLCKLIGTPYAPVADFCERYRRDGWIWAIESCEMNAGDIYRTLWQMRECGWLRRCSGVLFGRPDGYSDTQDFTLADALRQGLGPLGVPVLYGCDIGHIPPQMQLINGAYAAIRLDAGKAIVKQEQR